MEKRKVGNNDLEVSALGLGCMGMSYAYGQVQDKREMIKLIDEAVKLGVIFSIQQKCTVRLPMKN